MLGMFPALLTVVLAGLIALLALIMDKELREYALQVAVCFRDFAAVLVGAQAWRDGLDDERHRSADSPGRDRF